MLRLPLVFILTIGARWVAAQATACTCEGLVDANHKQPITLLDQPGGKTSRQLSHRAAQEDYLVWKADRQQDGYFHATVSYAVSGKSYTGWHRQAPWLGTLARAYGPKPVPLYAAPRTTATVKATVPPQTMTLLPITRCGQGWVYVRAVLKGNVVEGWLAPEQQCANHYTTCN